MSFCNDEADTCTRKTRIFDDQHYNIGFSNIAKNSSLQDNGGSGIVLVA